MASIEEAKAIVHAVAKRYGHLDEEKLKGLDPDTRQSIQAKEQLAGHSIQTLAKNIYGDDARFVFELLQNADDNRFERAKANGAVPFISFNVYDNRIVIDCNEDGFTEQDLYAICTVGESTKSRSSRYIGAKGIGFKSVFNAAWNVQIQSGNFSFEFTHQQDDSGLGMVTPIWRKPEEDLRGPLTRTTLFLHTKSRKTNLQASRKIILKQLDDLQTTCLLFLQNIKWIRIILHDKYGAPASEKSFRADSEGLPLRWLETQETDAHGRTVTVKKDYHVTTHSAANLPVSDNREAADDDASQTLHSSADIVLAFPLTAAHKPDIDGQQIFAFLPIRESSFKFIIQSDFDTSANRQDVSTSSRRNVALRGEIVKAMVKAILQFCDDPNLCYTWPLYLPQSTDNLGAFWSSVVPELKSLLEATPVLYPRNGRDLKRLGDVFTLPDDFRDTDEEPLLDDADTNLHISSEYEEDALHNLEKYGLESLSFSEIMLLLEADLKQDNPKYRDPKSDTNWHNLLAKAFSRVAEEAPDQYESRLKRLAIIPLGNGKWISTDSHTIYMPETDGISIPSNLDLRVGDAQAFSDPIRRRFFELLGVVEAQPSKVRSCILRKYKGKPIMKKPFFITLSESIEHLCYLYLTHSAAQEDDELDDVTIFTVGAKSMVNPRKKLVYMPSQHHLGPEALLIPSNRHKSGKFAHNILNPAYLEQGNAPEHHGIPTWDEWLTGTLQVERRLRLSVEGEYGHTLSPEWRYVHMHHPEKLLHLLKYLWKFESSELRKSPELIEEISDTVADELCSCKPPESFSLRESRLPLSQLVNQANRFLETDQPYPFLDLGEHLTDDKIHKKWTFLSSDFGINMDDDCWFLVEVLDHIVRKNPFVGDGLDKQKIFDLYVAIEGKCISSPDPDELRSGLRTWFREYEAILVASADKGDDMWASTKACLWKGPQSSQRKFALAHSVDRLTDASTKQVLSNFFCNTLQICDASYKDLIEELEHAATSEESTAMSLELAREIYEHFSCLDLSQVAQKDIRVQFRTKKLIYCEHDSSPGFYKSSDCLWATSTYSHGKVALAEVYEACEEFFTSIVRVQRLTFQMIHDRLAAPQEAYELKDINGMIFAMNEMLAIDKNMSLLPDQLLDAKIFPVLYPGGSIRLVRADREFAVIDREQLQTMFEGCIKFLNFSLEEVRTLRPFLEWTGLSRRYLSATVYETTSVSEGKARPVSHRKRNLKSKARGLLRVAATFRSPRYIRDPSALYDLLRNIDTMETDYLLSVIRITQDGKVYEAHQDKGSFHIEEDETQVRVYVPAAKKAQEFCYASALPIGLARWLLKDLDDDAGSDIDKAAETALSMLMSVSSTVIDRVLESQGIIKVGIADEDTADSDTGSGPGSDSNSNSGSDSGFGSEAGSGSVAASGSRFESGSGSDAESTDNYDDSEASEGSSSDNGSAETMARMSTGRPAEFLSNWASGRASTNTGMQDQDNSLQPAGVLSPEDQHYKLLLEHVVEHARQADFPSRGSFDMRSLHEALLSSEDDTNLDVTDTSSIIRGFRAATQMERDKKIGAAGELYVFEIMSRLNPSLSGWGRANWKSTIRSLVTLHADYEDMRSWRGRETADLTYMDKQGQLTRLLIEQGYLAEQEWKHARPEYFLEVKATTGPLHTPFFMSKHQFKRMQRIHALPDHSQVYMVLRVFELEEDSIGMRVYLDPEQLRQDKALEFTAETYSVVPA